MVKTAINETTLKICAMCKVTKFTNNFYRCKKSLDGKGSYCKECSVLDHTKRKVTKQNLIHSIYNTQVSNSKKRGHVPPLYTKQELYTFLNTSAEFNKLYSEWVTEEYVTMKRPSIDRIDNNKGYTFLNIKVMTWEENKYKYYKDRKTGKCNITNKGVTAKKGGNVVASFHSIHEAGRVLGLDYSNISKACRGITKTCGGFSWEHTP